MIAVVEPSRSETTVAEATTLPDGVAIRPAGPDELAAVMGVLDAALLATDAAEVRERIHDEAVLVAVAEGRVLGTLVLDGTEIAAVAVRRARRDQGIGTALVETADAAVEAADTASEGVLSARFRAELRPFYESLGFSIRSADEADRLVGRRE